VDRRASMKGLTYKKAGVDIKSLDNFKERLKKIISSSYSEEVLRGIGGFGGLFRFPYKNYRRPVLVSSADGVGTKLKIASLVNKHDTVGIDCVAMNVNDILCTGAKPLFFLDYIAYSKLKEDVLLEITKGLNRGCSEAGCFLIGGETGQMPGMYKANEYDLAGFCVGVVEENNIIDGSKIEVGDVVVGLESNGLHSNGFSLVRKVFSKDELKRYALELLKPTRIYVKPILSLLLNTRYSLLNTIKGIAHITGGAFYDKISRILPDNVDVLINKNSWLVPKIFRLIQNKGGISDEEMYHTFNMGIGMILIVSPKIQKEIILRLKEFKINAYLIGEVIKGKKQVQIP